MNSLQGIRILDFTRLLPGPFASWLLHQAGAEVIKIESPFQEDELRHFPPKKEEVGLLFRFLNEGKKLLSLDLKTAEGKEIFKKLLCSADVVLEGFRPGVTERLGIDYPTLSKEHPRLIYCSLTGYGTKGPYCKRAGHDLNFLALSGALNLLSKSSPPSPPGFQLADISGALYTVIAILLALLEREKTKKGKYLSISMVESAITFLPFAFLELYQGHSPSLGKSLLFGGLPNYQVYATKDGRFVTFAALEPKFWQNFCQAIGRDDLLAKNLFSPKERQEVQKELEQIFREKSWEEWREFFLQQDVCGEPVWNLEEVLSHPQLQSLGTFSPSFFFRPPFSQSTKTCKNWRGVKGEHTIEILKELGFSQQEIQKFQEQKIITSS